MDESTFDEFYAGAVRRVTAHVYALTGDWEEAQDCTQEAFARAWSHRGRLDRAQQPEAWVRTTAHRLAISRWRRLVRGRRPADRAMSGPVQAAAPGTEHVELVRALTRLPAPQREALVLHHLVDLSVADIAAQTGVPEGTVKARLSRGRAALAGLLADDPAPARTGRKD